MTSATLTWTDDRLQERHRELTGDRMRRNGHEWRGWCSVHEVPPQGSPSADYRVTNDGTLLAQCRSRACDGGEMVRALAGTTKVVYPTARPTVDEPAHDSPWNLAALRVWLGDATDTLLNRPAPHVGEARAYLKARGITRDEVERFGLGVHIPGYTMDPPEPLDGDKRRNLSSLAYRVIFATGSASVEGRLVPALADVTYAADRKYDSRGPKRLLGLDLVVDRDEVVFTEGIFDAVAIARVDLVAVACRGQQVKDEDVAALAHRGVRRAYLALDHDAGADYLVSLAKQLLRFGIEPVPVHGIDPECHGVKDPGDLLTADDDRLWAAVYGQDPYREHGLLCTPHDAAEVVA